jgi:glutamyl-tRNA reductase
VNPICVGVSHRSAGLDLLERLVVPETEVPQLLTTLLAQPYVEEAVVLSTCNRVEIFASVTGFHGGLADVAGVLATRAGVEVNAIAPNLYVHYESAAVQHVFRVAAGLDSMIVGEPQILGQLREAYSVAAEHGAAGRIMHELLQHALRVGKRAQSETGIDKAGQSVVSAALDRGEAETGPLAGRSALVIGAGGMGALSLATLRRAGVRPLFVANRGFDRAAHLAAAHEASAVALGDIGTLLATIDIVVTVTAATEPVLLAEDLLAARPAAGQPMAGLPAEGSLPADSPAERPLLICDLAVPRNVGPGIGELPGVTLVDMDRLATAPPAQVERAVTAAQEIVTLEVDAFLTWLRGLAVAPTVAALRARAEDVVSVELRRLAQRRPEFTDVQRAEVATTVHRIVQRLLHQPSVRVRELAAEPGGERYARALRELFDLQVPVDGAAPDIIGSPALEACSDERPEDAR